MAFGTTLKRIKWPALNGTLAGAPRDWLALLRVPENGLLELNLPSGWPEAPGALRWQWHLGGSVLERGAVQRLSELPAFTQGATVRLWTPATETLLTRVTLPTRSRARILQALPFALEDQLLGEPQSQHFIYAIQADGSLAVAVTARARMEAWIGALRAAGLVPDSLCPDSLQLPLLDKAWTLRLENGALTVRTGLYSGFSLEQTGSSVSFLFDRILQEARRENRAPEQLLFERAPEAVDLHLWSAALGLPVG
ncbi:MAG: type II secretion system protein GspL, partial [Gammaproteobacteria bacterium]|nr:type II secretion system protein GspL [Gammaproteobacteria bacterium]